MLKACGKLFFITSAISNSLDNNKYVEIFDCINRWWFDIDNELKHLYYKSYIDNILCIWYMYTETPLRHQPSMLSYANWNVTSWSIINIKHTSSQVIVLPRLQRLQPLIYRKANSSMWNHHLLKTFPLISIYTERL